MFGRLKEQPPPQSLVGTTGATTTPGEEDAGRGPPEGLILLLFVVLTLAASALVLTRAADKLAHDPSQKASRGEIKGLDSLSMLRAANLRRALAKVADSPRPLISNLRVSAARADLTVRDNDGSRKLLNIDPGFKVTTNDFGVGEDQAVRASQIDAAAPERMVRSVAERTGLGPEAVDYVTVSLSGTGEHGWYMSLKQGPARVRQWVAAPDGSDLRKPGELSRAQQDENARLRRRIEAEQLRIKRQLARRRACLVKATDVYAASRCAERFPL
ncbi:MAG: hypothetical protein QOH76_2181 [Thermoleophilaceae bacterium]|nr:hypothetical protein [Thermoleophilaceae bacterium]